MLLLRRTYSPRRVLALLTSGMSRRHIRPHCVRQLYTATGKNTANASSSKVFALALGSVALGLGGYYVGVRRTTRTIETPPPKPVYGTPEDFAHAIQELETLLSKDMVRTDEDQLEAHGFSLNSYHPGTPRLGTLTHWFADLSAIFG
jgi:D-lactate dehydrogenase (cytochrome)